jgi:simple sugar transport system ATP-binding protein
MVHQHFMLVPVLTVAENILLGEETMANPIFLDRAEARRRIIDLGKRFGFDFSSVRVHAGAAAAESARDVNAHAYTVGHNIVFDAGRFAPGTQEIFAVLAVLRRGHSIIFISHKLYEVLEIAIGSRSSGAARSSASASRRDRRGRPRRADGRTRGPAGRRSWRVAPSDPAMSVQDLHVADDRGHEPSAGSFELRSGEIQGSRRRRRGRTSWSRR